ncbi:protein kinase family protein [Hazenella sp. IB182353]|uniref:protein kinase family protein n=1 Tax=Polycladospora coralii TaxID=2771432 RepID=UPI001747C512|nr:protein kinase family protein [Polycladospora coralii]MBS7530859.1 protein kinase family protein [Polycladospora coralii]
MKQESSKNGHCYEDFEVVDVIKFFSGELIEARGPDGKIVYLQNIKASRSYFPSEFQDALRKLKNPHIAPIFDVLVDKDRLVLVHPPLKGEPLSLVVNKNHVMDPEQAMRVVLKLFKTVRILEQLPVAMRAPLDPRNILLDGENPMVLFLHLKTDTSQYDNDLKWRDLLYFLLVGESPDASLKQSKRALELKGVPDAIIKIAMSSLDKKQGFQEVLRDLQTYVAGNSIKRKKEKKPLEKKRVKALVGIPAVSILILTTITLYQLNDGEWTSSILRAITGGAYGNVIETKEQGEPIVFEQNKNKYKMKQTLEGNNQLIGDFVLKELKLFEGYLETVDELTAYGVRVDKSGKIGIYIKRGDILQYIGDSGDRFVLKPGETYSFQIFYFPGEPIHVSIIEKGTNERWTLVGSEAVNSPLKMRFTGSAGDRLYTPTIKRTDRTTIGREWMKNQPWKINIGQAILNKRQTERLSLDVYPQSTVSLTNTDAKNFTYQPPVGVVEEPQLFMMLNFLDGSNYSFIWKDDNLILKEGGFKSDKRPIASDKMMDWKYDPEKPVEISASTRSNDLTIVLSQGDQKYKFEYSTEGLPISLKEVTLANPKGFSLIGDPVGGGANQDKAYLNNRKIE